jgi:hypothetical protein
MHLGPPRARGDASPPGNRPVNLRRDDSSADGAPASRTRPDGAPVDTADPGRTAGPSSRLEATRYRFSGQRLVAAMRPPKRSQQHVKAHRLQDPRGSQRAQQAEFTSGSFPDVWAVPRRIDVDSITITHVLHPPLQRGRSRDLMPRRLASSNVRTRWRHTPGMNRPGHWGPWRPTCAIPVAQPASAAEPIPPSASPPSPSPPPPRS